MKFCPKYKRNIGSPLTHHLQKYECKDCGYIGAFIVYDGAIAEENHKKYLNNQNRIEDGE